MLIIPISRLDKQFFCSDKSDSFLDKPMLEMTIQDNLELAKKLSHESHEYKENLILRGLKGDITESFIRQTHPHRFDETGKLTQIGRNWATLALLALKFKERPTLVKIKDFIKAYLKK